MTEHEDNLGRQLWRQHRTTAKSDVPQPELSLADLAAWMDGRADEELARRVEARLAQDDRLLLDLVDLAEATGIADVQVPASVIERARSLVAAPAVAPPTTARLAPVNAWWRRMQYAAAAAAVILSCYGGYRVGQAPPAAAQDRQAMLGEAMQGLQELVAEDTLDMSRLSKNGDRS